MIFSTFRFEKINWNIMSVPNPRKILTPRMQYKYEKTKFDTVELITLDMIIKIYSYTIDEKILY